MTHIVLILFMFWSWPVLAEEYVTHTQVEQLYKDGKLLDGVELVMANLDQCNAMTLLHTGLAAKQIGQFPRAVFLSEAGRIRAEIDMKYYEPTKKEMKPMGLIILMASVSQQIFKHPSYSLATTLNETAHDLMKWAPSYTSAYDPGWTYEQVPNFQDVQEAFTEKKDHRVLELKDYATYLNSKENAEEYLEANSGS